MARKYFTQVAGNLSIFCFSCQCTAGMEAPRNSLEFPVEIFQGYGQAGGDHLMYAHQEAQVWSEKNCFPSEAPMKKLINEDITKMTKSRVSALSVVARLMGVDMLPLDGNPVGQQVDKMKDNPKINYLKQKLKKSGSSSGEELFPSETSLHTAYDSCQYMSTRDDDEWNDNIKLNENRRREHPQEEELQKFKRDFSAWQSTRFKECAKVVETGSKTSQLMVPVNLTSEKVVPFTNSEGMIKASKNLVELENCGKVRQLKSGDFQNHSVKKSPSEKWDPLSSNKRRPSGACEWSSNPKLDNSSVPMNIVILRPGVDSIYDCEEYSDRSSRNTEERDNMEDFLEEVKERLKHELQGKANNRTTDSGGLIETSNSEKPSEPKKIAQRIAKQVRESVAKDLGVNLIRSESTRSYRSEVQYNRIGSPEFISRNARNFLTERLRNVLKGETRPNVSMVDHNSSSLSMLTYDRDGLQNSQETLNSENQMTYWGRVKIEQDKQSRSFRHEPVDDIVIHKDLSPRNLIRSLSAPVSGTSFGKLLLEDRHILTGAQIRRKHEVIERSTVKVKKQKKEKFNLKDKVSSFKHGFSMRGRLFSRKIQSPEKFTNAPSFLNDITSGPTVMMNFCDRHENSTEVPPSPASICSSGFEESWRPAEEYCSPTPSDLHPSEENMMPLAFREISSNLIELRRKLNQLDASDSEQMMTEEPQSEDVMAELDDQSEAFVRDLLVASGLYDGSTGKSLSRWDPFAKPISDSIYEEVEDAYLKRNKNNEEAMHQLGKEVNHRLLLDLLNETLSTIVEPPITMTSFRKNAIGSNLQSPRGRKLLGRVWDIMCVHIYPPADTSFYSLEGMVARDLQLTPWSVLVNDNVDFVGKAIECWVVGDLIDEIVKDMGLTV
ncbi:hypothetical protein DCAR_0103101 [Daucus carota subsp. sativus]|uniref:DUF4378 domain-containing protein n=1 Tax=Daucus carota subsp. sativus TaxID=79200 RepID=A0AAF1AIM6_DAUCS|nr:hypothetical protein DCAR_0103101 [Daucus carota subsp. sativus]